MKKIVFAIIICFLLLASPAAAQVDIDLDNNNAVDIAFGGTNTNGNGLKVHAAGGTYTIGTTDPDECFGGVVYVTTAGATLNACPAVAHTKFTVITVGAIQVILDPDQTGTEDTVVLDGTALAQGANVTNTSTTGDVIYCEYYTTDTLYCMSGSPDGSHWAGP